MDHELDISERGLTYWKRFGVHPIPAALLRPFFSGNGWYPTDVRDFGEVPRYGRYFEEADTSVYLFIAPLLNDHYAYDGLHYIDGVVFSQSCYVSSRHDKRYKLDEVPDELMRFIRQTLTQLIYESTERLHTLETLRRQLEAIRHEIGSMSDYLDRGRPSPEEAQKTHASMAQQEKVAADLERQLTVMVKAHRRNQPRLIDQWATIYQAIFQELNACFETHQEEDVYAYRLERHVTAQAIEKWGKVRSGELDFVINNGSVMGKRQAVVQRYFGF
ncbi:MAG: hypothetical protein GY943_01625 [Chloroflexi bacterium]|nr:hypothetical protein [Chloroflexota bacterium]